MMIRPYNFLNKKVKVTLTPAPNLFCLRYMKKSASYLGNKLFRIPANCPRNQTANYADRYRGFDPDKKTIGPGNCKIKHPEISHKNVYDIKNKNVPGFLTSASSSPEGQKHVEVSKSSFDGTDKPQYFAIFPHPRVYLNENDIRMDPKISPFLDQATVEDSITVAIETKTMIGNAVPRIVNKPKLIEDITQISNKD